GELTLRRPPTAPARWQVDPKLFGSIDEPVEGAVISSPLFVRGWARIPGRDLSVLLSFDGRIRTPSTFKRVARDDVAMVLPSFAPCTTAGYEATFVLGPKEAGPHRIGVVFRTRDGRERLYPETHVVVRISSRDERTPAR